MAKEYRDIVNPITSRDWFLYYVFNDPAFITTKKRWQAEIYDVEAGEPGVDGLPFLEQEKITRRYIKDLGNKFNITDDTVRKGLSYTLDGRVLNRERVPFAKIENDRIVISIGSSTRLEDIEHLWNIQILSLQEELPSYSSQRDVLASEPLVAYLVHSERLKGRTLTDIHKAYLAGTLDVRLSAGNKWLDVNDFRKYYDKTVKGYVRTS